MGRSVIPLEERMRTVECMIEECSRELKTLRKCWVDPEGDGSPQWMVRLGSQTRVQELGTILAYLRLKRSDCYDELEGEDEVMN
jgi:hypothetical protein